MEIRNIGSKIQSVFNYLQESLSQIEIKWTVFIFSVFFILIFKALGAAGVSLLIGLVYIMYFVTLKL